MNQILVKKTDLLKILNRNREQHYTVFLEAQKGYRKAVIKELDKMLAEARGGKKIRRLVDLVEPSNHTDDYDTAIQMLEMDINETVTLDRNEYRAYVEDNWGWGTQWAVSNSAYLVSSGTKRIVSKYLPEE